ncbi:hypothetical protein GW17_00049079 [Ensete ventricosum]|nr:hypothetical protein GW17_00049079 [Ensete ventricosum]RZR95984.1 hypothetical protein BHM03_00024902 [Ensete ventricosum]
MCGPVRSILSCIGDSPTYASLKPRTRSTAMKPRHQRVEPFAMASSPVESPTSGPPTASDAIGSRSLAPCYTSRIWKTLRDRLPSLNSSLLAKISHIFRRGTPAHRHRRRRSGLPLPLHSSATMSSS